MADVPTRRAHELSGLDDVVFDLERSNDFEGAGADLLIQLADRAFFRLSLALD